MVLGIMQLPDLVGMDHAFGKQLKEIHGDLGCLLAVLIALHVTATMYHNLGSFAF